MFTGTLINVTENMIANNSKQNKSRSISQQHTKLGSLIDDRLLKYLEQKPLDYHKTKSEARESLHEDSQSPAKVPAGLKSAQEHSTSPTLQHIRSSLDNNHPPHHYTVHDMTPSISISADSTISNIRPTKIKGSVVKSQQIRELERRKKQYLMQIVQESVQMYLSQNNKYAGIYNNKSLVQGIASSEDMNKGTIFDLRGEKIGDRKFNHDNEDKKQIALVLPQIRASGYNQKQKNFRVSEASDIRHLVRKRMKKINQESLDNGDYDERMSSKAHIKVAIAGRTGEDKQSSKIIEYRMKKKRSFSDKFYELKRSIDGEQETTRQHLQVIHDSLCDQNNQQSNPRLISKVSSSVTGQKLSPQKIQHPIYREQTVYTTKISLFRDFLFKVNYAHGIYDSLELSTDFYSLKTDQKYRYIVGRGNNSLLIKSLMKRRFWWVPQQDYKNSHFYWTQLKVNDYYLMQQPLPQFQALQNGSQEDPSAQTQLIANTYSHKKVRRKENAIVINPNPTANKYKPTTPQGNQKIFTASDLQSYEKYENRTASISFEKLEIYDNRLKFMDKKLIPIKDKEDTHKQSQQNPTASIEVEAPDVDAPKLFLDRKSFRVHNHLQFNYYMGNKKAMFYNMRQYYQLTAQNVFNFLPLTFHIKKGIEDKEFRQFLKYYKHRKEEILKFRAQKKAAEKQHNSDSSAYSDEDEKKQSPGLEPKNIWIMKPGELSNRGNGITVVEDIQQVMNLLRQKTHANGTPKTHIIQQYIDRPLLYQRRKFDIRHYMMITNLYGVMRGYWYSEGYIRTSSEKFDLDDVGNKMIHLTNDAVQKYGDDYGLYEEGNKLSYQQFQKYLDTNYPGKNFFEHIYPKMKQVAMDAIRASYIRIDPRRLQHNFEIFGLDFMIDQDFKVWLIEINTNPCLEISSQLLRKIIPTMVDQSLRLSLDVLFPPPTDYPNTMKHLAPDNALENLKYELIFDELRDGPSLQKLFKGCSVLQCGEISQGDDTYQSQGEQINQDSNL